LTEKWQKTAVIGKSRRVLLSVNVSYNDIPNYYTQLIQSNALKSSILFG